MAVYISSFYPLCSTKQGRAAIKSHFLPPYIDGSCRREPDFSHSRPCITGLCRPNFINKLKRDDIIIYATNKPGVGKRLIVAIILQVDEPFVNHSIAAKWYADNGHPLPNNLLVIGNLPYPLDQTHQRYGSDIENRLIKNPRHRLNGPLIIRLWDKGYATRSKEQKKVALCHFWKGIYNLNHPPKLRIKSASRFLTVYLEHKIQRG